MDYELKKTEGGVVEILFITTHKDVVVSALL